MTTTLKNFEMYAATGNPISGATVKLYAASNNQPNGGSVLSTTSTDAQGMWQFTGLADGDYDVSVEVPGEPRIKWYKGNARTGMNQVNGALPTGVITTTQILDGTIATGDLAANAVSQTGMAVGSSSGPTTTSASFVDLTDMAVTLTTVGGDLLVWFSGSFLHTVVGTNVSIGLSLDGAAEVALRTVSTPVAGYAFVMSTVYRFTGVAAGSHTVKVRWNVSGVATGTAFSTQRSLVVEEVKR